MSGLALLKDVSIGDTCFWIGMAGVEAAAAAAAAIGDGSVGGEAIGAGSWTRALVATSAAAAAALFSLAFLALSLLSLCDERSESCRKGALNGLEWPR
jgi:hypothetical protein